jgi:hypothetical protein
MKTRAGTARSNNPRGIWRQIATNLRARARLRRQQATRARSEQLKYATPEQLAYARMLDLGVTVGRYVLITTFAIYAFGLAAPKVPFSELSLYWSMPVSEYLRAAEVATGWGWLDLVGHGDYMNFLGIAVLAGLTVLCYLRVLPFAWRRGEINIAAILVLEIAVLAFAASGLLAVGH